MMLLTFLAQITPGGGAPELPPIRDIAPPVDVLPWPWWMVAGAVLLLLLLLALLVGGVIWLLKRRPKSPPPTPREIALRELEKLRLQAREVTPHDFSFLVSDVLRSYIGAQYGLHAREQTSPEFLAQIARAPQFSARDKEHLTQFLERCDLLKFAQVEAAGSENTELLESARNFVTSQDLVNASGRA